MSKATDLDRHGCTVGGRRLTYQALLRYYVCNECGGKLTHTFTDGDRVFCGACEGEDFVSEHTFLMQIAEAREVLASLPPDLRALLEDEPEPMGAEQAISELFD